MVIAFAAIGCGADDEPKVPGEIMGGSTGQSGGLLSLSGTWVTTDLECEGAKRRETVQIDHVEETVSASMLAGSDCIPPGYVVFEGKLPRAEIKASSLPVKFDVDLYNGEPGDPASIAVVGSGQGTVVAVDGLELKIALETLRFTRTVVPPASDGEAPVAVSAGRGGAMVTGGTGGRSGAGGAGGSGDAGKSGGGGSAGRGGSGGAAGSTGEGGRGDAQAGSGGAANAGSGAGGRGGSSGGGAGGSAGTTAGRGGASGRGAASECDEDNFLEGASCDHVAQCGCAERENCRFYEDQPPRCLPAGSTPENEACDSPSACDVGLLCVDGTCLRMCRVDADCDGGSCEQATRDGEAAEGLMYCNSRAEPDTCDPVLPSLCFASSSPSDEDCFPCGEDATCIPDSKATCVSTALPTLRRPESACTTDNQCFGGGCNEEVCRPFCRADFDCPGIFDICKFGFGHNEDLGEEIGLCIPDEF